MEDEESFDLHMNGKTFSEGEDATSKKVDSSGNGKWVLASLDQFPT